ncbi:MAG: hflK [Moraxellaceae bacterium]|jgi:membrane protease subunit HflK|nr:hflK [Moraxellaceae bacterium]
MAWNASGQKPGKPSPGPRPPPGGAGSPPPGLDEMLRRLGDFLGEGPRPGRLLLLAGLALVFVYGSLGVHQVEEGERSLVLRNGRLHQVQAPGLHWNPPLIDTWRRVNIERLREATLSAEVISRDGDLVAVTLALRYRVADPEAYLLGFLDAEAELLRATEAALQQGASRLAAAELTGPAQRRLVAGLQAALAAHLRERRSGLALAGLSLVSVRPPAEIEAAVTEVERARADIPLQLQKADEVAQKALQRSREEAARQVAAAEREKARVVLEARADALRLGAAIEAARVAPAATRQRLYEETVADVLARTPTVIVGEAGLARIGVEPARLQAPSPLPPPPAGGGRP